jgi:hypothetical protein
MVVRGVWAIDVTTPTDSTSVRVEPVIRGTVVLGAWTGVKVRVVVRVEAISTIAGLFGTKGAQMPAK